MSEPLRVPRELRADFDRFRVAFDRVTAQWVARGEETDQSVAEMRNCARDYITNLQDADEHGQSRRDRLQAMFAYWHELAVRTVPEGIAVRPVLGHELESRLLDREWALKHKGVR